MVEARAGDLEAHLLGQCAVCGVGQTFPVWLDANSSLSPPIRFQVPGCSFGVRERENRKGVFLNIKNAFFALILFAADFLPAVTGKTCCCLLSSVSMHAET